MLVVEMMQQNTMKDNTIKNLLSFIVFCDSKVAEKLLKVSERTLLRYRKQNRLIEGIHWGKNPSGKILYNQQMIEDLIICKGNLKNPEHQKFIQRCLSDRPENQPLKRGRKQAIDRAIVAS